LTFFFIVLSEGLQIKIQFIMELKALLSWINSNIDKDVKLQKSF